MKYIFITRYLTPLSSNPQLERTHTWLLTCVYSSVVLLLAEPLM